MDIDISTPFITELENPQTVIKKKILTPPAPRISKNRTKPQKKATQLSNSSTTSSTSHSWLEWAAFFFHMTRVSVNWLHHVLKLLLVSTTILAFLSFVLSFRADLNSKADAHRSLLLQKRVECERNYVNNKCWPLEQRVPALQEKCEEWGEGTKVDIERALPWSSLYAKTLAETVEGFFNGVSWHTKVFFLSLLAVYFFTGTQRFSQPIIRIVQESTPSYPHRPMQQIEQNNPFLLLTEQ